MLLLKYLLQSLYDFIFTLEPDPNDIQPCTCETIEVPTTSSERSSSFNSCTLPLKPLKGILKKNKNQNHQGDFDQEIMSMTLPRDARFTMEVIPFDQMPPCEDCLQRARHQGSYGDVCQNFENSEECGFQMHQIPIQNNPEHEGFCCKHGISTGTNLPNGSNSMLIVSQHNSFDEKEEVEAVESSV